VGLPKRRGTIASAAQTPSTRRRGVAGWERVQTVGQETAKGRFRVEGLVQGPSEWRAGPVVGWGCSACAARFFGGRDDAPGAAQSSPQKPPHGAEHPHPTPPARDAAGILTLSLHQKSRPLATPKPPDRNELQPAAARRQREAEQAPAASKSSAQPAAPAALRRPQGAPAQLETNGLGHASTPKPRSQGCLPKSSRDGRWGTPGQNTQARLLPRVLTRGAPPAQPTAFREAFPRPRVGLTRARLRPTDHRL
jgi:hypothetical protein